MTLTRKKSKVMLKIQGGIFLPTKKIFVLKTFIPHAIYLMNSIGHDVVCVYIYRERKLIYHSQHEHVLLHIANV